MSAAVLTYKYRLLPTKRQHATLREILEQQRLLYNAALEERISAYTKAKKSIWLMDQQKSLTVCRREIPEMAALPLNIQRGTLGRLDKAFQGFYSRVKRREKPGFPRFQGKNRFQSFEFAHIKGLRFDGKRIRFKGLDSGLKVHMHRPLPEGEILMAKFKRDAKGWFVLLIIRTAVSEKRQPNSAVGLDVGIKTLVATSDGLLIPNPRPARSAEKAMRRRLRQLSRCKKKSRKRQIAKIRVAKLHQKISNSRNTYLHQISAMLVTQYDIIAVEALNTKGMARSRLARDINDAAWGKLRLLLEYKAERAGIHFIEVNPKHTSQTCPECGNIKPKNLNEREHNCPCGCSLDRDVAAAKIILKRAVVGPWALKQMECHEAAPGNIANTKQYTTEFHMVASATNPAKPQGKEPRHD
jgi:putative transposase